MEQRFPPKRIYRTAITKTSLRSLVSPGVRRSLKTNSFFAAAAESVLIVCQTPCWQTPGGIRLTAAFMASVVVLTERRMALDRHLWMDKSHMSQAVTVR